MTNPISEVALAYTKLYEDTKTDLDYAKASLKDIVQDLDDAVKYLSGAGKSTDEVKSAQSALRKVMESL